MAGATVLGSIIDPRAAEGATTASADIVDRTVVTSASTADLAIHASASKPELK
jgi:hypothetical protein